MACLGPTGSVRERLSALRQFRLDRAFGNAGLAAAANLHAIHPHGLANHQACGRRPVPLQADCCYFHGMAESQFLNKAFSRTKPIEAPKMKGSRSPARLRPYGTAG